MHLLLCLLTILYSVAASGVAPTDSLPYRLSEPMEISLCLGSAITGSVALQEGASFRLPPASSILLLNRERVNAFDRSATYRYSKTAARISDVTEYVSLALPLLHLIPQNSRRDFGKITMMAAETAAMTTSITWLFKNTIRRERPLMYNPDVPMEVKNKRDNYRSFFSGHTAQTAAMSFFFAQTFAHYHPRSRWKPVVWSLCAALPVLTAVMRYEAGKHYWTDVITGYAVGALVGMSVPWMHKVGMKHRRK